MSFDPSDLELHLGMRDNAEDELEKLVQEVEKEISKKATEVPSVDGLHLVQNLSSNTKFDSKPRSVSARWGISLKASPNNITNDNGQNQDRLTEKDRTSSTWVGSRKGSINKSSGIIMGMKEAEDTILRFRNYESTVKKLEGDLKKTQLELELKKN